MVISELGVFIWGLFYLTSKNNCHLVLLASLNAKLSSSSRVNTHRWERGISLLMELSARKSFPKCQTVLFTSDEVVKQEKSERIYLQSFCDQKCSAWRPRFIKTSNEIEWEKLRIRSQCQPAHDVIKPYHTHTVTQFRVNLWWEKDCQINLDKPPPLQFKRNTKWRN